MDKQTESRSQFEAWFKYHSDEKECLNLLAMNNAGSNYLNSNTDLAWIAWTVSRESLVVELPKSGFYLGYGCPEYMEKDDVIESIRAIGIRIKGEDA